MLILTSDEPTARATVTPIDFQPTFRRLASNEATVLPTVTSILSQRPIKTISALHTNHAYE
jgi:hypothetical protein